MSGYVEYSFPSWEEADKFDNLLNEIQKAMDSYQKVLLEEDLSSLQVMAAMRQHIFELVAELCGYDQA